MYLKILEKSKIELLHHIEEKSFMMEKEIMGMVDLNMMEDGRKLQKEFLNTINASHYLYNFINGPWKSMPFYNEKNEITGSVKNWKIINLNFKRKNFFQKIYPFNFL